MYQRNSSRNRNRRRVSNDISFRDPVTMNRNHPFGSATDINNQYNRLQQLVRQQSPSSTTSSTASSSTSSSTSPPANISSLTAIPQHLQLLIQQHQQLIAAQHAHQQQQQQQHQQQAQHAQHAHQQLLAAAAQQQQQHSHSHAQHHSHSHHHRHRHHRHNRLLSHQQQQQQQAANETENESEHKGKNMRLSAMDFDQFRVKNKSTWRINWREYERRMESVEIDNEDTNKLIMDYLLCEGDYDIAMEFGKESQTNTQSQTQNESDSLMDGESKIRSDIVSSINGGNMLLAIDLILCNNYNVDGCVSDAILLELHKQHLIELIICNKINEAFKYNLKYLLPKTKKKFKNNMKLLQEIGDIMTLIACRNIKNIPQKQRNLLSLDRRQKLSNKINRILLKNDKNNKNRNESLLFENMCAINYYQNFLMNLGIKEEFDRNKINLESAIMSYNEENIKKVKERHPEFGKNNKHRTNNDAINGITNWIKLDNKYRLKVKNYLPFAVDTSKCQQFKVKSLKKYNIIHVTNVAQTK